MTLEQWKEWAEVASGFATAIGILVAGIWTYLLFVKNREKYPVATVSQEVSQFTLSPQVRVIRVAIKVENKGKVLLPIREMDCRLLQIFPIPSEVASKLANPATLVAPGKQAISWPYLEKRTWRFEKGQAEIEPGESDIFRCDFIIYTAVDVVQIDTHLKNSAKDTVGWSCLSGQIQVA
jgi:hypothetical protein